MTHPTSEMGLGPKTSCASWAPFDPRYCAVASLSPLRDPGGVGLVAEAGRPLRHPQLVEVDVQGLRLVLQVDFEVLPGVLQHSQLVPRCLRLFFQPSWEKGILAQFVHTINCSTKASFELFLTQSVQGVPSSLRPGLG